MSAATEADVTSELTIMFADISSSTQLFETLGDTDARTVIAKTLAAATEIVERHHGTVVKTIGDEIMCTFSAADHGADAATQIQELMDSGQLDGPAIKIRIGLHHGPALQEAEDVFGDAVNIAARMAAQAKGEQIITTRATVDLLSPQLRSNARFVDHAPIKGKKENIEIFEIIWQQEDVTKMTTSINRVQDARQSLEHLALHVIYDDMVITINQAQPKLMLGRSKNCDLMINEKMASRQHVQLELRRDKFFIIDQSTNGTYISMNNVDNIFLRREETQIIANGRISLGASFDEGPEEIIYFILRA